MTTLKVHLEHYNLLLPEGLGLRAEQAEDRQFCEQLFRSSRAFLADLALPQAYLEALLGQQFQAQQYGYSQTFPDASRWIICHTLRPIGKVIVARAVGSLHIVDLAVLPEWRSKGFGTAVLKGLQALASREGLALSLSVEVHNVRAKRLYASLGFHCDGSDGMYASMCWNGPDERPTGQLVGRLQ